MRVERSPELRRLVLGMYHDWSSGDLSFLDELFSGHDGALAIGTDPDEWWPGGPNIRAIFKQQITETDGMRVAPGADLQAWSEGTVGWVADTPTIHILSAELDVPARITMVFHREQTGWALVQWHASVGQRNEQVLGFELTTSIAAVAEAVAQERPDLTATAAPDGTVTIAFTDIEESTALNERLGDRGWVELVRAHDRHVRERAEACGGSVVKSAGDGFMLAFPSARRGLECAVALQRELAEQNTAGHRVRVRMGLHTGEPIREGDDFFGRDVAYAARVASAATGGEILVSSLVRELTRGTELTYGEPRELEFKGFDGPQPVYPVVWSSAP
jgi:adenylate cyclase